MLISRILVSLILLRNLGSNISWKVNYPSRLPKEHVRVLFKGGYDD
jgi:hypothetical protein